MSRGSGLSPRQCPSRFWAAALTISMETALPMHRHPIGARSIGGHFLNAREPTT